MAMKHSLKGREHLDALDRSVTFVASHVSAQDPLTLANCLPGKKHFVMLAGNPAVEAFASPPAGSRLTVLDSTPASLRELLEKKLDANEHLVVFPESRPNPSNALGKVGPLAVQLAERLTEGWCVPVDISLRKGLGGPVVVVCCPRLRRLEAPEGLAGDALRAWRESGVRKMLEEARFESFDIDMSMSRFLVHRAFEHGMDRAVFRQVMPEPRALSFRLLLRAAFALGGEMAQRHEPGERIGLMLPTAVGAAAAFYASHVAGVVPVMLNFSAGSVNLVSACETAQVGTVYTAKAMLEKLEAAKHGAEALEAKGRNVVMLEDVRDGLKLGAKLKALSRSLRPLQGIGQLPGGAAKPESEAVVLFTSGSEGPPKGVVLSHRNLIANASQVLSRLEILESDQLFNSLPIFHSFGMIGGLVLPVAAGLQTLQFPSPLLYREIPAVIHDEKATITFSTGTFLGQYGQHAHPSDFAGLRLAIAGGEQLKDKVKEQWLANFGRRIHEGYGVTETAPALAVSTDQAYRPGSIGTLLPGVEHRIEQVEGVSEGGRLVVSGPNVMLGYMFADNPGVVVPPAEGWHDTGDIVTMDDEGFVKIVGRVKRFAKIAGEMVPLGRVEEVLDPLSDSSAVVVISLPDPRRGEELVAVTTDAGLSRDMIQARMQEEGLPELWAPRKIVVVPEIPLMPTGKTDYPSVTELVSGKAE